MLLSLPALFFGLTALALWRRDRGARDALLTSALICGVLTVALTELLSPFHGLTRGRIALGWLVGAGLAGLAAARAGPWRPWPAWKWPGRPPVWAMLLAGPVVVIVLATGLLALAAWPNAYDGMIYHLPRVMAWRDHRSLEPYPSANSFELFLGPMAEFGLLHVLLLGGQERPMQLVQWLSMLGSLVGVSRIAERLGAGARGQWLAALFAATLPIGIYQASTVKNDYVLAFWIVCLANATLAWGEQGGRWRAGAVGAGAGLAYLTKASAPVFILPLGLLLVAPLWERWRAGARPASLAGGVLAGLGLAAAVASLVNGPALARNLEVFGNATGLQRIGGLGSSPNSLRVSVEHYGPRLTAANLLRDLGTMLETPSPAANAALEAAILRAHDWLGVDPQDPRITWRREDFGLAAYDRDEGQAGNPVHVGLTLLLVPALGLAAAGARNARVALAGAALLAGGLLFAALLKWQPQVSRLELPLLVLWSAPIGWLVGRRGWAAALVAPLLVAGSLEAVGYSRTHPLLGERSVLSTSREEQLFASWPPFREPYVGAAEYLESIGCAEVALVIAASEWTYPFWALVPALREGHGRLEHILLLGARMAELERARPYNPCAVVVTRRSVEGKLTLGGRTYQRAWTSGGGAGNLELKILVPRE